MMIEALKEKLKHRIITVTLCPNFDRTLWVKNFEAGATFLATSSDTMAAGKGVNVSRALINFNIDSIATGLLPRGGASDYIRLLEKEGINHNFQLTSGKVRINTTIISGMTIETHIRERGSRLAVSALTAFKKKMLKLINKNTIVVFSGRLPEGFPDTTYFDLVTEVKKQDCLAFLDVSGASLQKALAAKPFYIKPNLYEVQDALGYFPAKDADLIRAVGEFHNIGIQHIVISRGKDGILYSDGEEMLAAKMQISRSINTVGSGDATVAGSVVGILSGLDNRKKTALACACGAANTLLSGAGRFQPSDVTRLFKRVEVSPVS
ncbi:MAG: hexose kinase [Spirochaetota bacterium]|nr:MAG: hexose kinase [Spirochaetota bacterium]